MPIYKHRHSVHKSKKSRRRKQLYFSGAAMAVLIGAGFFVADILTSSDTILQSDPKVLSAVNRDAVTVFSEKKFTLTAPDQWVRRDSEFADEYEVYKYGSDATSKKGRTLEIFVGKTPRKLDFNKVMQVAVVNDQISPISLSPQCYELVDTESSELIHVAQTVEYKKMEFLCNPSSVLNRVGVINKQTGNTVALGKNDNRRLYTFLYTDHTFTPSYKVFEKILEDFKNE